MSEVREIAKSSSAIGAGSVDTIHLAAGAVTEPKLANGAVTSTKLADRAVESRHVAPDAVTGDKIAARAVTKEKLAPELWPVLKSGTAKHGETVEIGEFKDAPFIAITSQSIPVGMCGEIVCALNDLRCEDGVWRFDVLAAFEMGADDGEAVYPGEISWTAIGFGGKP